MSTEISSNTAVTSAITSCNSQELWQDRSFLIEMKPRQDFASMFIDCPPSNVANIQDDAYRENEYENDVVKVGDQYLELIADDTTSPRETNEQNNDEAVTNEPHNRKFTTKLIDILLDPNSVCALSWADNHRLFMCKVRAEADSGVPFSPKAFRRFEDEINSVFPLREYVEQLKGSAFTIICRECQCHLHSHLTGEYEYHVLPDDDWLDTSPQLDYYCAQTCGGAHASHGHSHQKGEHDGLLGFSNLAEASQKWLPTDERIVFTNSFVMFQESETLQRAIKRNDDGSNVLNCNRCVSQIGTVLRNHNKIYKLHISAIRMIKRDVADPRDCYVVNRFGSFERYFAWMLLYKCESQSSMKLLIRAYNKVPYLLVWILEPYVIFTKGVLEEESKVQITTDPRANGMDSSVGIVDVPVGCCLQLIEILLASSHALPPSFRSVGQLYVGFLRLKDHVD
ncbi:HECT-like ubiquitin-conjugating enzyme (E2)-binding domain-containing protein [Ditylenchus destructor]|uniref:E3 ubiquitin-protein ligase E3D n=1 Tax=Ditylenchus destructor TaxID=166010 RepID=A0AAD4R594_9BILA|nr:HECT-like ubiquitin-conjugating enzyme (E2)-binding domain-containing protein [Ditylenchus destructor]